MADLKSRLAERIKEEEKINNEEVVKEDAKVIMLNNNENTENQIVIPEFVESIEKAKDRIEMLKKFVKDMMIQNIDYGIIPNCNKPTLFKAGAEKLCDIFGFSKEIEVINRFEDWEKGLFHYEVKARLINKKSGLFEAEGIGACNTKERKYRGQDSFTIINTVLKMAKKRALIDAVLSATRSSGIFTQDIEDIGDNYVKNSRKDSRQYKKEEKITKEQQTQILLIMQKNKIPPDYAKAIMKEKYNVNESKQLTLSQGNEFIDILKCSSVI